jgi:hypothetical protein
MEAALEVRMGASRHVVPGVALVLILSGVSVALAQGAHLNSEQKKRIQALSVEVDEVTTNKHSAPQDVQLTWRSHFLKAGQGLVYIPYTIGIDGRFTTMPVAMYLRVLSKDAKAAYYDPSKATTMRGWMNLMNATAAFDPRDIRSGNVAATGTMLEDAYFFEPASEGRLDRALWLPPGEYTIIVAMRERADKKSAKTVVFQQPLTVPDLSRSFALSSVIIADSIEPTAETLDQQKQLREPYTIAGNKISPLAEDRFPPSGEFSVVFFVYNAGAATAGKPDVRVDYTFLAKAGDVERVFTRVPAQSFNAQTLPPQFDLSAGHQILAGQVVELRKFPPGDYRLEIRALDNTNGATAVQNVTFSVARE